MASIRKRGDSYQITISNGRDSSGKQLLETTTFTPDPSMTEKQQKKAIDTFVFEFEQKVKSGKLLKGEKLTLKEFSEQWLKEYVKNNLSKGSYKSYSDNLKLRIIPALGHIKLSNLNPMHLQSYYNNLQEDGVRIDGKPGGYSAATIKKDHVIISSILTTAVHWQLIESNPCDRVSPPKVARTADKIKFFTFEQTQAFLDALDMEFTTNYKEHNRINDTGIEYHVKAYEESRKVPLQYKVFFYISIFGGFRKGEVVALTWEDINFEESTISINKSSSYVDKEIITKTPKTKTSRRSIKLPGFVMQLLKEWKKEQNIYRLSIGDQWIGTNHVFTQLNGNQMHPSTPYHTFVDIIHKYNKTIDKNTDKLPVIPLHGLRHTAATLLIAENVDVKTVSSRLGHAQTSTTMNIYAHALTQMDEKAANVLEDVFKRKA